MISGRAADRAVFIEFAGRQDVSSRATVVTFGNGRVSVGVRQCATKETI